MVSVKYANEATILATALTHALFSAPSVENIKPSGESLTSFLGDIKHVKWVEIKKNSDDNIKTTLNLEAFIKKINDVFYDTKTNRVQGFSFNFENSALNPTMNVVALKADETDRFKKEKINIELKFQCQKNPLTKEIFIKKMTLKYEDAESIDLKK